jgi:hypothetical protein
VRCFLAIRDNLVRDDASADEAIRVSAHDRRESPVVFDAQVAEPPDATMRVAGWIQQNHLVDAGLVHGPEQAIQVRPGAPVERGVLGDFHG